MEHMNEHLCWFTLRSYDLLFFIRTWCCIYWYENVELYNACFPPMFLYLYALLLCLYVICTYSCFTCVWMFTLCVCFFFLSFLFMVLCRSRIIRYEVEGTLGKSWLSSWKTWESYRMLLFHVLIPLTSASNNLSLFSY